MSPRISIIIVTYHATPLTHLCLWSLALSKLRHSEVIIVDNAGNDLFLKELEKDYPFIQIIHNTENEGFGKACNKGHQMAQGEISLFLNPDTMVPKDFENRILTFFKTHPECGAMGAKMIDGTGTFLPESKRNFPTPAAAFMRFTGFFRFVPHKKTNFHYYAQQIREDQTGRIPVLSGAFMAVSRKAMDKTGGFDPRYFMYSEDIDLSWQISQSGFEVWYNPEIKIIHFKGETARLSPKFSSMFFQSMLLFYKKHYRNKHSGPFFTLILFFIKTLKFFSSLKYFIIKRTLKQNDYTFYIQPNASPGCIKKLQQYGCIVKFSETHNKESFFPVSSKEINPDELIDLVTTQRNLKNIILFLHEESGWLFQLNNKNGFVRTIRLTNVK